jgi:hypothetical protein
MVINVYQLTVRRCILCCAVSFLFISFFLNPMYCSTTELPSSFYVKFKGKLQNEESAFLLQFYNGTTLTSKNMILTFSMNQTGGDQYIICTSVNLGSFSNETTADAKIADGRLIIASIPSIFVISPDLLIDGEKIQLYQTVNRTLEGTVARTGRPPTAIGDYRVTSKMVTAYHKTDSDAMAMPLTLGFDPETGVLTEAAGQLTDVLLDEMGIYFILGGTFELFSYSENLNLDLVGNSRFLIWLIVTAVTASSCVITVLAYKAFKKKAYRNDRSEKRKKRSKMSAKGSERYYL